LKRQLRKTLAAVGASFVALAMAASVGIPVTEASANEISAHTQLASLNNQSQNLTVSEEVAAASAIRDGSTVSRSGRAAGPSSESVGGWALPIHASMNSGWGPRAVICTAGVGCDSGYHRGDDFAARCGTPIYAVADGVVTAVTRGGLAGDEIVIRHAGGNQTAYSHMFDNGILVSIGQIVAAGQNIAQVGSSGDSTGCHLYFEFRVNGTTVDPQPALAAHGIVIA
jgi:murein DD-endopeptidase MepM/ murein hydrolase activator NlpD